MTKEYEECNESKMYGAQEFSYDDCLFYDFIDCLHHFKPSFESCVRTCWRQHIIDKHHFAPCLDECYEKHANNHFDKNYLHNP